MKRTKTQTTVDIFGVLGYISLAFQWLWAMVLLLPWLLSQQLVIDTLYPSSHAAEPQSPLIELSYSPVLLVAAVVFSVVIVGVTLWLALVKAPKHYLQSTSKATHRTAAKLATTATKHHHVSKKRLNILTERVVFGLKLAAVVIGTVLTTWAAFFLPIELPRGLAFAIGVALSTWPLVWFGLQFFVARLGTSKKIRIL